MEQWLAVQAASDGRVQRLQTHPGVGLLTSLCVVHTLGDVQRFRSTRKVAAYVGFDPMEDSSAERKAYGGISKAGSRLLRYLLIEAGQTAAKDDEQFYSYLHVDWTVDLFSRRVRIVLHERRTARIDGCGHC